MNLNPVLFLSTLLLLLSCNQKQGKSENRFNGQLESNTHLESKSPNFKKKVAEYAMSFSPKGASAYDSIPEDIVQALNKLRTIDKNAHEKYVTLIFTKLYAEHLRCCHQSHIIEEFPMKKKEYDFNKLTMANEFAFMSNYLKGKELPEVWSSGIILQWLTENPQLMKFEPIGRYKSTIDSISKKIADGEY